jgi:uracil phosphoribosyltransferase
MYIEVRHPLVQHKLSLVRDKATGSKLFRELVGEISKFLAYEALREIPTEPVAVETPLETAQCHRVTSEIVLVPILRAGIGMLDALTDLVPNARIGFLGMYRDPVTSKPVEYYAKLPQATDDSIAIVIDPMLATGGSSSAAVQLLKDKGFKKIIFICIVSCPEGLAALSKDHPSVPIYTACVDRQLNDHNYILPGLGDAGDRLFGTK